MEGQENMPQKNCCGKHHQSQGFLGGAYGLAFIGAAVYYIQHSATFWVGVLAC